MRQLGAVVLGKMLALGVNEKNCLLSSPSFSRGLVWLLMPDMRENMMLGVSGRWSTISLVEALVRSNVAKLTALDKYWCIDELVLKAMTGEGAGSLLRKAFETRCLPSATVTDVKTSLVQDEALLRSYH